MRLVYSFSLMLITLLGVSQTNHFVPLDYSTFYIYNSTFYVTTVIDNRADNSSIGLVKVGAGKDLQKAQLQDGFTNALQTYYTKSLYKTAGQKPVIVAVNQLTVSEKYYGLEQTSIVDLIIEYREDNTLLFIDTVHHEFLTGNATKMHGYSIAEALTISINNCHKAIYGKGIISSKERKKNRNITAVGYQIGGLTLVGIDQEFRISDPIGIHLGIGFLGFTAGVKAHFRNTKDGGFINLSYKDGGFGQIRTVALEYGGHYSFSKRRDFGGHFQIGLAKITQIEPAFETLLFKGQPTPNILLSVGAGFSW